ncbi:MAG TPA: hypothetical protein VMT46_12440 [Anaerolineaceae bacterium]|nr:hypothetical protein [Anaerolineaceae bacterium]
MGTRAHVYEIRIEETLDDCWTNWFSSLEISRGRADADGGEHTILRGAVPDQAALYGILASIRNLNLTLVSVHRLKN